jgi:hypothetical protein
MSSDDYIFILKTPVHAEISIAEEYRVKHVLGAYWESEEEMLAEFEKSPVFYDKAAALLHASDLLEKESEVYPVEYGIRFIESDKVFPDRVSSQR